MLKYSFEKIRLNLKYTWAISRGATDEKTNFVITIKDKNGVIGKGEIAPNIRYGETIEGAENQLLSLANLTWTSINDISILNSLQLFNSVRFGIESALISFHCNKSNISISDYFQLSAPNSVYTAYTIPIMEIGEIKPFFDKYDLQRFQTLKIKIGKDNGLDMIQEIHRFTSQPMIVDANEAFTDLDEVYKLLENLRKFNVKLIEQPFPSNLKDEYIALKPKSPFPIFADESVTSHFNILEILPQFHGVNMKLMKAGGLIKGVEILKSAKAHGLKTMIGCMVETTLSISHGWQLCSLAEVVDLDSFMVLGEEPFGLVREENGELKTVG